MGAERGVVSRWRREAQICLPDHPIRHDQCLLNKQLFSLDHSVTHTRSVSIKLKLFLLDHSVIHDMCLLNRPIFTSDHPIKHDQCLSNRRIFTSDQPIKHGQCLLNKQIFLPDHPVRYDQCLSNMANVFGQQTGQDGYGSEHNSTHPRRISALACSFLNGSLGHVTAEDRC